MMVVETPPPPAHIGELRLRRFRGGELVGAEQEQVSRHTASCGACRGRLRALDEEQRQFEREISFERFAGGVERARRVPRVHPRRAWTLAALAFASAAAAVLVVWAPAESVRGGLNRIKGGPVTTAEVRIAAAAGTGNVQRAAAAGGTEVLRAGERLRIGVRPAARRHVAALSIDDAGQVTAIYPRPGQPLSVERGPDTTYLPDSLELTGAGQERMFLLLSDRPLDLARLESAARAAHARAQGDLRVASSVQVDGNGKVEQFTWLFEKRN